jgi:hypothetical protein
VPDVIPDWQREKSWNGVEEVDYELKDEWLKWLNAFPIFEILYTCAGHPEPEKAMKGLGIGDTCPGFSFRVYRPEDMILVWIVDDFNKVPNTHAIACEGVMNIIRVECTIEHTGSNQAQLAEWWELILQRYKYLGGYWKRTIELRDNPEKGGQYGSSKG